MKRDTIYLALILLIVGATFLVCKDSKCSNITNTYWRDNSTGNWYLGITEHNLIFDNRIWDIESILNHKEEGRTIIKAHYQNDTITLSIGSNSNGCRTIVVDNDSTICSRIESTFLPDYPQKDSISTIADNGYHYGDSVTIIGWLKDMPQRKRRISNEFAISYYSLFTGEDVAFPAKLDNDGRFLIRFPIENSQMLYCDWHRSKIMLPVEPGECYLLLKDFSKDKTLVMGSNARLQNEWLGNSRYYTIGGHNMVDKMGGIMNYLEHCNKMCRNAENQFSQHCEMHPTLSERFINLQKGIITTQAASNLMQARFEVENYRLPDAYIDSVTTYYWSEIKLPYSLLGNSYTILFRDFSDHIADNLPLPSGSMVIAALLTLNSNNTIELSNTDLDNIADYSTKLKILERGLENITDSVELKKIIEGFNNSDAVIYLNQLLERPGLKDMVFAQMQTDELKWILCGLDSLNWSSIQRDIYLSTRLYRTIDGLRVPLDSIMQRFADTNISLEAAKRIILSLNNHYEEINSSSLNSSSVVGSLPSQNQDDEESEGEALLQSIITPHKGKIILVDIWGTWCGPCREALKHSQQLYQRLKDYPMVYIYLANNSPKKSWENVIKEYNITGDNVIHYNLPTNQQSAIENLLNVNAYPTYLLFDMQGNLLRVRPDARQLDELADIVSRVAKQ